MAMSPYNHKMGQEITTDSDVYNCDRAFLAHYQIPATDAVAADTDGILTAMASTTIYIAASAVVKAASAVTDTLTVVAAPATIGAAGNDLSIELLTAADDNLAVTKNDLTGVITISLANTTAAKNTAALIQAAIRAFLTVGLVDVSALTCTAGGNWNTAAIATGETEIVLFTGGQDEANDVVTTFDGQPGIPRNITATAGGTAGDIAAIQVVITGTNVNDEVITETLAAFTVNTPGTVAGTKAFKTITSVTIPAHDGLGATTAIGWGEILSLPYKLPYNTVLATYLNGVKEGTAPTVTTSVTVLESNTIDLNSALNGTVVDVYLIV